MTEYISYILAFMVGSFLYRNIKLRSEVDKKNLIISQQQKDFQLMTAELKGLMSLNKMCIEKWEKAVLDNTNLNQSNYQLIKIVEQNNKQ